MEKARAMIVAIMAGVTCSVHVTADTKVTTLQIAQRKRLHWNSAAVLQFKSSADWNVRANTISNSS